MPDYAPAYPDEVSIQLPGATDIIKVPFSNSPELRRERIERFRNAQTPLPQSLQWIPELVNKLDQAQDLLYVTLVAGRPLLRKIPSRMIPYLGWVLLFNDLLNLVNSLFGAALTSRFPKRDLLDFTRKIKAGRAGRITFTRAFLNSRFPWAPFLLQAGQVLHDYTGWGLQLGTVMGAATDAAWSLVRLAQGSRVRIVPPPASDPWTQAAQYVQNNWILPYVAPALSVDDIKLIVGANAAAASWLGESQFYTMDEQRLESYAYSDMVATLTYPTQTIEDMEAVGIQGEFVRMRPGLYTWAGESYSAATRRSIATEPFLDQLLADKFPPTREAALLQEAYEDTTEIFWDLYNGAEASIAPLNTPWERLLGLAMHRNVVPPWFVEPCAYIFEESSFPPDKRRCRWYTLTQLDPPLVLEPFRFPRMYPPRFRDRNWQLTWWLTITLAMICRKDVWTGIMQSQPDPLRSERIGLTLIGGDPGSSFLDIASVAVWGNVWSIERATPALDPERRERIKWCVDDPETGWPRLTGFERDSLALLAMRQMLPRIGTYDIVGEDFWGVGSEYDPEKPFP